jgi:outer membrane receptor protein involved in Fe transport
MRILIAIILLVTGFSSINAQTLLRGKVQEKKLSNPVEYATVSLLKEGKIVDGATTDSIGQFTITNVETGSYQIKTEFLGYQADTTTVFIVSANKTTMYIPVINLAPNKQMLDEVTINSSTPIIENKIDKIVYNAANDLTAQGGVALDVLKKVPQVSVDVDGNVELQGSTNIRFLINGKPSGIFGSSLADALASIPASEIKSIEAITSPGAKYDAQGSGGIINIILKESKMKGINGSINLSAGTRLENGAVNINVRKGNVGISAFVSGNAQLNSRSLNNQDRHSFDATDNTYTRLQQDGYSDIIRKGYQAGINVDWSPSKTDFITGGFQYDYFSNQKEGITQQQQDNTDINGHSIGSQQTKRYSLSKYHNNSFNGNVDYKKKFKQEGREINLSYNGSYSIPVSSYEQTQTNAGELSPNNGSASNNPGKDNQTYLSLDYTQPISKDIIIETGAKTSFQHINSINDQSIFQPSLNDYEYAPSLSYNMNYNMNVYAAYIAASINSWNFIHIKGGLRVEHTDVTLDYNNTHIPSYNILSPSIILSHNFNKQQSLKLAYSRRLERPEYDELNPFLNLSDPYNITTGNPLLKPEIGNNIELGYSRSFENGGNFYVALTERINTSDVKPFTTFYPSFAVGDSVYTDVSITNRQNVGEEYNSGAILSVSMPINNFNIRGNAMFIQRHMVNHLDGANPVTNALTLRFNLNASYKFSHGFMAEAFGNYRSPTTSIQGKQPQFITYTFAIRKQLFHNNASIGITATNVFSNYVNQVTTIESTNYSSYAARSLPLRSVGITFNYKFGKLEFGKTKSENEDQHNIPSEN